MYTPLADSVCEIARVPECPLPITVINDSAGLGGLVAQVLGHQGECIDKRLTISDVHNITIKICEKPFMWIEKERVGTFDPIDHPSKFWEDKC